LPEAPRVDELRAALEQRAADWRETLRKEPAVARMLVRRLISPLELCDASAPEWQMPDFIRADTEIQPGLLEGLVPHEAYNRVSLPAGNRDGDVYTKMGVPKGIRDWLHERFPRNLEIRPSRGMRERTRPLVASCHSIRSRLATRAFESHHCRRIAAIIGHEGADHRTSPVVVTMLRISSR